MRGILVIGITTLIVVLIGTISLAYLQRSANELAELLNEAQIAVQQERWPEAASILLATADSWNKIQGPWGALINHGEIDEIRMALERSQSYVSSQDKTAALAELAVAKLLVEHVPEKVQLTWSNIF